MRVRTAMGAKARAEDRFLGGRPPYGYLLAYAGPHPNPELRRMGVRLHRLVEDPSAGPVVTQIFAWRAAGRSASAICHDLDQRRVACPSAHDPERNRHRSGTHWTVGAVLAILRNPRYLGFQVWGRARKSDVLVDPANVQLGTKSVLVDNPAADWLCSDAPAQPALVDSATWELAQQTRCQRSVTSPGRTYLLAGLLRCAHYGKRLESAWNNGRATYRCKHSGPAVPRESDAGCVKGAPSTLSVRQDLILQHLPALLLALGGAPPALDVSPSMDAAVLRERHMTLIYDHNDKTITADSGEGPIRIKLR